MKFETTQNTPVVIDFKTLLNSRSWELSGNTATHYPCNDNTVLKLLSTNLEQGVTYTVTINILTNQGSLGVGINSPSKTFTDTGLKTFEITPNGTSNYLTLWGSGYLVIEKLSYVKTAEALNPKAEVTLTYSEIKNGWIDFRLFRPEVGFSIDDELYSIKNGVLYIHKTGTGVYNSFYGRNYDTYIEAPISSLGVKTYQSIAIHSNRIVGTSENGIRTQLGHVSDLFEEDFNVEREGIFYANYLRDKLTDIISGDRLKGRWIVVDIRAKGNKKLQIFKIVNKSAISTPNE